MKYLTLLFALSFFSSYSQCENLTSVRYLDNSTFSKKHNVSVKFGKSHEISNGYDYVDSSGNGNAIYCLITGFKEQYLVKLYTSGNTGYNTNCSSINSLFRNGYIQGKDNSGRIWKIYKPSTVYYNNSNDQTQRRYNKTRSRINTAEISRGLSRMQNKLDRNKERIFNTLDKLIARRDLLDYRIKKLNNPTKLTHIRETINKNMLNCSENIAFESNSSVSATISCLKRQLVSYDILEMEIDNYSVKKRKKDIKINYNNSQYVERKNAKVETKYLAIYDLTTYKDGYFTNDLGKVFKNEEIFILDKGRRYYKIKHKGKIKYIFNGITLKKSK